MSKPVLLAFFDDDGVILNYNVITFDEGDVLSHIIHGHENSYATYVESAELDDVERGMDLLAETFASDVPRGRR